MTTSPSDIEAELLLRDASTRQAARAALAAPRSAWWLLATAVPFVLSVASDRIAHALGMTPAAASLVTGLGCVAIACLVEIALLQRRVSALTAVVRQLDRH